MISRLPQTIVDDLKRRGWWYEQPSEAYQQAMLESGIEADSPIYEFMSHAEDQTEFKIGGEHIYQLGWHLANTNLKSNSEKLIRALNLPNSFLSISSFEGEGGFFYDRESGKVYFFELGSPLAEQESWSDFCEFFQRLMQN